MKLNKELKTVFLLGLFSILISFTAEANGPKPGSQNSGKNGNNNSNKSVVRPAGKGHGKTVAVPLDGGVLALLAGAGITYFAARRRKKKEI